MGEVVRVIYSPSEIYKVEIIKRKRDGLFTFLIHKWIEHDPDIKEIINEEGFWGPLFNQKSLTDTAERAIQTAPETRNSHHSVSFPRLIE
ncbi:hypothetical protein [Paenibacillus silagei]|uniref:Transposase n=1 Tax=Paenibacillus silagei TaxID=1670801 RepID=A0ABS4NZQ3_9BACL|nr:hypothetical protein [Paenibacillus silagei]MBP2115534.1 hypothetical protein [Paenibacillus silagei]